MSTIGEKLKDFMANFEGGQLVGVDIGLSAIKVALLSKAKKNTYRLDHYFSHPLSEAAIIEDEIQKPDELIEAIVTTFNQSKIKKRVVCLGMSGPHTVSKRLQVPDGSKEDVEDNIMWESEQYIPFGADDAEIGFSILRKLEEEDIVDAIVGAVETDTAEKYVEYLKEAGLVSKVVDLNVFALTNIFENLYKKELEEISDVGAIIVDFGAQYTTIIVYRNEGPVLTKEINIGGVLITEEIQRSMGVSYSEAEDLKVNGDEGGNLPEEIIEIIDKHIAKLLQELKKTLNFYIAAGSSEQVGRCFITGGSSRLPNLVQAFQGLVDLEVEELNPFQSIELKANLNDFELEQAATCGMVAMGLAMRSV